MASINLFLLKTGQTFTLSKIHMCKLMSASGSGLTQTLCRLSSFTNTPSGIIQQSQGLNSGNITNQFLNTRANHPDRKEISACPSHMQTAGQTFQKQDITRSLCLLSPKQPNITLRKLQQDVTSNNYTSCLMCKEQLNFQQYRHYSSKKDGKQVTEDQLTLKHFGKKDLDSDYVMPHPIWSEAEVYDVKITHNPPETFADKLALWSVRGLRAGFDVFSGFNFGKRTEKKWLRRVIFLETVAGVPGMMGAMARHLRSLRRMQRDYGWIHTLLEEAENERMHLLTFLHVRQPGALFRGTVLLGQGIFVNVFFLAYLAHPRFCHRFVGYLEEEAVKTYTKCLEDIDSGDLWKDTPAPELAEKYWQLQPGSSMRDVVLAIRADEAHHRLVNHTFGSMSRDEFNPYKPGK